MNSPLCVEIETGVIPPAPGFAQGMLGSENVGNVLCVSTGLEVHEPSLDLGL